MENVDSLSRGQETIIPTGVSVVLVQARGEMRYAIQIIVGPIHTLADDASPKEIREHNSAMYPRPFVLKVHGSRIVVSPMWNEVSKGLRSEIVYLLAQGGLTNAFTYP